MSNEPLVLYTVTNSVARVVMNRPGAHECYEPGHGYGTAPGAGACPE